VYVCKAVTVKLNSHCFNNQIKNKTKKTHTTPATLQVSLANSSKSSTYFYHQHYPGN